MWFLKRLRTDFGIFEAYKLPLVRRGLGRPNRFRRPDVIVGNFPAQFSVHAENFVLFRFHRRRRTYSETDIQPAIRENVQRCNLLRSEEGVAAGDDYTGDAESDRANQSRKIGKRRDRFIEIWAFITRMGIIRSR